MPCLPLGVSLPLTPEDFEEVGYRRSLSFVPISCSEDWGRDEVSAEGGAGSPMSWDRGADGGARAAGDEPGTWGIPSPKESDGSEVSYHIPSQKDVDGSEVSYRSEASRGTEAPRCPASTSPYWIPGVPPLTCY